MWNTSHGTGKWAKLSLLFVKINRDLPQILKQSSEHQYKVEEILWNTSHATDSTLYEHDKKGKGKSKGQKKRNIKLDGKERKNTYAGQFVVRGSVNANFLTVSFCSMEKWKRKCMMRSQSKKKKRPRPQLTHSPPHTTKCMGLTISTFSLHNRHIYHPT